MLGLLELLPHLLHLLSDLHHSLLHRLGNVAAFLVFEDGRFLADLHHLPGLTQELFRVDQRGRDGVAKRELREGADLVRQHFLLHEGGRAGGLPVHERRLAELLDLRPKLGSLVAVDLLHRLWRQVLQVPVDVALNDGLNPHRVDVLDHLFHRQ
ncbi:hypothetical protein D3C87_1235930 [compost metagenome]